MWLAISYKPVDVNDLVAGWLVKGAYSAMWPLALLLQDLDQDFDAVGIL